MSPEPTGPSRPAAGEAPLVLVTGASSGIGRALAGRFAAAGHPVALLARREGRLRELAGQLERGCGVRAHVLVRDLAEPDAAARTFEDLTGRGLRPAILVNNAGFGVSGRFGEAPVEAQLEMLGVNVTALVELTALFLRQRSGGPEEGVLNVASTAAFFPGPLMSVYYASKAFVLSFSQALAEEHRDDGLRVCALCPGPTSTEFAVRAGMEESRLFGLGAMSAERVAEAGYDGFREGRRIVVPGRGNRLAVLGSRVLPRRWLAALVRRLQESR